MRELYAGQPGRPPLTYSLIPGGEGTPIPEPPKTLKNADNWTRLWTVGRAWLSNDAHYDLLQMICESMEDRARIQRAVRKRAVLQTGSGGQEQTHPGYRQLDQLDIKIGRLLDQAGFSPLKRRTQVDSKPKSKLAALRAEASGSPT